MKKLFLLSILLLLSNFFYSQVGINTEKPSTIAELEIINTLNNSGTIIPKGILIPRMTEAQRDGIDISKPESANSLMVYNTDEDCYNYYSRIETEWKSLCGALGKAVFTTECDSLVAKGIYSSDTDLTTANYLLIKVNVTKPGSYNITGITNNDNGYYFSLTGQFLSTGTFTIHVPGYGTPNTPTETDGAGDQILISNNGELICNELFIKIEDSSIKPDYSISCGGIVVNGTYIAGTPLTINNTIQFSITAASTAAGAFYELKTNSINGYSFEASGVLTAGTQVITMTPIANSTPRLNQSDKFTISSNSTISGGASCEATVKIAARNIKLLALANSDDSYDIGRSSSLVNKVLLNTNYFGVGQDAIYPVNGFQFASQSSNNIASIISSFNPDIIFVQYNWYASTADITTLTNFVNNGGVLVYCSDGDGATSDRNMAAQNLARSIFNNTTMTVTGIDAGDTKYDTKTIQNSGTMITNGPFMNLNTLSMGRDAGNNFNFNISGFPYQDANVIAFNSSDNSAIFAFCHKTKGFVFFGDGAPFAAAVNNTNPYNWPAKFTTQGSLTLAIPNTYSVPTSYNSFVLLNTIAWAVDYAVRHR